MPQPALENRANLNLNPIQSEVVDAIRELFKRATSKAADSREVADNQIVIADDKPDLNKIGPLQDCEFGMILVLAREWCNDASLEPDFFGSSILEQVVLALVKRVIDRVFH